MMTGTRITVILTTTALSVPLIARQIITGGVIHGRVGRNESLTRCHWERGLTAAFGATHYSLLGGMLNSGLHSFTRRLI